MSSPAIAAPPTTSKALAPDGASQRDSKADKKSGELQQFEQQRKRGNGSGSRPRSAQRLHSGINPTPVLHGNDILVPIRSSTRHQMKPHDMIRALRFRLSQLETVEDINVALAEANTRLQKEVATLRRAATALTTEYDTVVAERDQQTQTLDNYSSSIIALQDQLTAANQKNAKMRKILVDTRMSLHTQSSIAGSAEENIANLRLTIVRLTEQLRSVNTEHSKCAGHRIALQEKLQASQLKVDAHKEHIAEQAAAIERCRMEVDFTKSEKETLTLVLSKAHEAHANCEATHAALQEKHDAAVAVKDRNEATIARYQADTVVLERRLAAQSKKLEAQVEQIQAQAVTLSTDQQQLADAKESVAVAARETADAVTQLKTTEQHLRSEQASVKKLRGETRALTAHIASGVEQRTALEQELARMTAARDSLNESGAMTREEIDGVRGELLAMQQSNEHLKRDRDMMREQYTVEARKSAQLIQAGEEREQRVVELQASLLEAQETTRSIRSQTNLVTQQNTDTAKLLQDSSKAYTQSQAQLEEANAENAALRRKLAEKTEDADKFEAKYQQYKAQLDGSETAYIDLTMKFDRLTGAHDFCGEQIDAANSQIEQLKKQLATK